MAAPRGWSPGMEVPAAGAGDAAAAPHEPRRPETGPGTPIGEAELQAYTDNRLPDERRRVVEAWLASHPDDAARIAAYRVLGEQWRAAYAPVIVRRKRRWRVPAAIAAGCAIMALGAWQGSEHAPR